MSYSHLLLAIVMLVFAMFSFCDEDYLLATACLLTCISNINQL